MQIYSFVFNPFQVNTYILYDETRECVIIDPACSTKEEEKLLIDFIIINRLKPKKIVLTHPHIDHIVGVVAIKNEFKIPVAGHKNSTEILNQSGVYAMMMGLSEIKSFNLDEFLQEKDIIEFGNQKFNVIYTPGHADGSICLYSDTENCLFSGDVLFQGSIGRSDLPSGNFSILISSITEKLMILPEDTIVYPGHDDSTTIGEEKNSNPYL